MPNINSIYALTLSGITIHVKYAGFNESHGHIFKPVSTPNDTIYVGEKRLQNNCSVLWRVKQ